MMSYFRAVHNNKEYSERALNLTSELLKACPGFYTGWHYRAELLKTLNKDLDEELVFLSSLSMRNHKNYQIWNYRRELIKKIGSCEGEIDFLNIVLDIDCKNIHVWGYRQWLITTFNLWDQEKDYVAMLLDQDPYNNSAWSQRYFLESHSPFYKTAEFEKKNLEFVLEHCKNIDNECPYSCLKVYYCQELKEMIMQGLVDIAKEKGFSRFLLQSLCFFYEKDAKGEMCDIIYRKLAKVDFMRKGYWLWKVRRTARKNVQRTENDIWVARALRDDEEHYDPMYNYYKYSAPQ